MAWFFRVLRMNRSLQAISLILAGRIRVQRGFSTNLYYDMSEPVTFLVQLRLKPYRLYLLCLSQARAVRFYTLGEHSQWVE